MLEILASVAAAVAFVGGVVSWFVCTINMFRTVANRKEGVPLFPSWYASPFNIVFRPHQLTDRGLIARQRFFYGVIGFFVYWCLGIAFGWLAGLR